jgi:glycosyltransferase involved in cell wall biosynthesis
MKVLTFTTLYPNNVWPNHGIFIKERMTHFSKLDGCKVKVVAPVPYFPRIKLGRRWLFSQIARQEIIEGLEVYHPRYFMTPKVGMVFYGLMMFMSALPVLKKIQMDFDLIDAHYVYPDGFAAVLLARAFNKPVVVSARGSDINLYMRFPLIRKLLAYTLLRSERVIAVSQDLKEAIARLGVPKGKVAVIPNGVDSNKFHPFPKEEARRKLGLPDGKILLSVGNLTPNKGFDLLVGALKILLEGESHEQSVRLVIIGEGVYRKKLEEMINSLRLVQHVRLAGAVPHEDLYLWYSAADLFCLASSQEGCPNVILEAMACGTAVVATNVGGIPEIVTSEQLGLLADRSEKEIAKAITLALTKDWQSDAILRYSQEHTWDHVGMSVHRVFKSVLEGRRNLLLKTKNINRESANGSEKKIPSSDASQ